MSLSMKPSSPRVLLLSMVGTLSCISGAETLPAVTVLATGGTIASKHDTAKGGYEPALTGEDLVAAVPHLKKLARINVEQISNISSSDITPAIWLRLVWRINELLAKPDLAAVVVTHGTNTLEETAFFLDLTIKNKKPVVIVGAQRPASDPDSDGPRNLTDAVRVAVAPEAAGMGSLVVMNGHIDAARDVTKTHTSQVETFRSLEFGPLGVVDQAAVRFYRTPLHRQSFTIDESTKLPRVEIVTNYAGADGLVLRSAFESGKVDGFVIAGMGLGGVSSSMFDVIQEVRRKGIPIVISTRVPMGRVFALSATKGSPLALKKSAAFGLTIYRRRRLAFC